MKIKMVYFVFILAIAGMLTCMYELMFNGNVNLIIAILFVKFTAISMITAIMERDHIQGIEQEKKNCENSL
jgi:hypothetical protein